MAGLKRKISEKILSERTLCEVSLIILFVSLHSISKVTLWDDSTTRSVLLFWGAPTVRGQKKMLFWVTSFPYLKNFEKLPETTLRSRNDQQIFGLGPNNPSPIYFLVASTTAKSPGVNKNFAI